MNSKIRQAKDFYNLHKLDNITDQHRFWKAYKEVCGTCSLDMLPEELAIDGVTLSTTELPGRSNDHSLSSGKLRNLTARATDPIDYVHIQERFRRAYEWGGNYAQY